MRDGAPTLISYYQCIDLSDGVTRTIQGTLQTHNNSEEGSKKLAKTEPKYKLLCPRGTQTCALAVANIAHAVYLLDVAKRPIPQG